jgi:3-phenylpropionate/cinnamic acid dioxygenase small subunit
MTDTRIAKLADEMEIRNLVATVARLADLAPDLSEYLTLWTEDGVYDVRSPIGAPGEGVRLVVSGRAELEENRTKLRSSGFQGPGTDLWHLNTTLSVAVNDDDTAEAHSYWVLVRGKGEPAMYQLGHYHDKFRRTAEGWKLAYRAVTPSIR